MRWGFSLVVGWLVGWGLVGQVVCFQNRNPKRMPGVEVDG